LERGTNENINKLIRRFIPKGTDISKVSKAKIKSIERWINEYPRRMFGYRSAIEMRYIHRIYSNKQWIYQILHGI